MREMKYSGIPSIGDVPTHWDVFRIKTLLSLRSEKNSGDRELLSVFLDRGVISYDDSTGMQVHKPSVDLSNYQNVHVGDFVLNNQQAWRGSVGVSKYDGIISPAYFVYDMSEKCYPLYMNFLLRDGGMVQQYETSSRGVGTIQRNLYALWFYDSLVVLPPMNEQKTIAKYLDAKCAEIDALIADVQTQIDVLEQYKRSAITEAVTKGIGKEVEVAESRVFYLGPINKKWDLSKIGYICTKLTRSFEPEDTALICSNKGKVLVRDEKATGIMVSEDNAMQGIRKGDIAIHGMDTWHGAIALSEMDGKITRVVHVCDSTEDKRFVVYWLQHLAFQGVYKLISNGVRGNTSDFRSWDKVSDIYIPIPTRQEQSEICDYLDHICKEVDVIVETKKNQLTVLEAYKKSLIFEYVTGKKEVPAPITAVMVDPNVILLGKLPKLLSKQKGKIYNQKVLYLLNTYLGLNLNVQYYRYKHGPYDVMLDSYIDTLVENGWCVKTVNNGAENLEAGPNYGSFEEKYGSCFSDHAAEINNLIQFVQPMKRSQIERVATLFAVWNDMILDGKSTPTDAEIVSEVMSGWTENKANFAYDTWLGTLNKMRKQGIIPTGRGLHTLPMPQRGVNNA